MSRDLHTHGEMTGRLEFVYFGASKPGHIHNLREAQ
jgi:hypothetical protein